MRQANCTPPKAGQQGVVLIAVLWIVMALSIIVTGLSRSVRDEAKMLSMARQGAQASALGDAAIQLVLQQMAVDAKPVDRVTTVQVPYQGRQMDVQVMPLNGLVDLNSAKTPLLARLLTVAGGLPESAAEPLAQAIVDYREQRTAQGASRRFEASEDLMRVPGVNYDLYARLSGLVTADIRSGGAVNPLAAPPAVLQVLAGGNAQLAQQIDSQRQSGQAGIDMTGLDATFIGSGTVRRYRLQARVPVADGGSFLVTRYVDINPRSRDGLPWTTFHMQREVEPALRPSP
ncbi:MAG: general secretion pathway protein GspK [Acidovorax temperans]|jgi:general secretion pathway protein K|uniref:general secretion pathway protein GspK n=1 Tax=Acidovorax temperans TaxID=80878 RepID=UPI00391D28D1